MTMSDDFDDIVSMLDVNDDYEDIINVQKLSGIELMDMLCEINDSLMKGKALFSPNSLSQREEHSLRLAIIVEISRRRDLEQ
jgi:hypothetical protein